MENKNLEVQQNQLIKNSELSVQEVTRQVTLIQNLMKAVMKEGEHYGKIPGFENKPSLRKAGAEKLALTFRLRPEFIITKNDLGNNHREYEVLCKMYHITSGQFLGEGVGNASTMEAKYRFRTGPTEPTGKPVPQEFWNLRGKNPGAAKELLGGDGFIPKKNESGSWEIFVRGEKVEHDNPADYYNTVIKIAKKRAFVDAILTTTAASDIFAEDPEDTENEVSTEKIIEDLINDCNALDDLETLWNKINSMTKKRKEILAKGKKAEDKKTTEKTDNKLFPDKEEKTNQV